MLKGFKDFISRGNVIDLAVGVIIGAAFGGIVDSLTKDVISPAMGLIFGNPDFSAIKIGAIGIGNLMNSIVNFLIKALGLYVFIVIPFNNFASKMAPPPSPTEATLAEIRDLLKAQNKARAAGA